VLDGKGFAVSAAIGVSVNVTVGVTEIVGGMVGTTGVSITGENEVFVATLVGTDVGGNGVEVKVQANTVTIKKIRKRGFRLIGEILLYSNATRSGSSDKEIKIPVLERGSWFCLLCREIRVNVLLLHRRATDPLLPRPVL
jgi:hypothetical protein